MNEIETALSQIENFQFIHDHLFSSGQPTTEQLRLIKEYGVSTVINVALTDSNHHLLHEDKIQCLLVLDLIDHLVKEQMVWVHCTQNYHVSCLMYLYRQYYMNMDMPTAQEYLHQLWEPNETWTGLIHAVALQLQGRKATQELELSLIHPNNFG